MDAVTYAIDMPRCIDFYRAVLGLEVRQAGDGFCILAHDGSTLTLVQVPDHIAIGFRPSNPPARRADTPVKLVFSVASISATRAVAEQWGGQVDPAEAEWEWAGTTRCDGIDPEGNVFQVSAPRPGS